MGELLKQKNWYRHFLLKRLELLLPEKKLSPSGEAVCTCGDSLSVSSSGSCSSKCLLRGVRFHTQNNLCLCSARRPVSHRVNRKMAAVKGSKRCLCFSQQCSLSLAPKVTYAG